MKIREIAKRIMIFSMGSFSPSSHVSSVNPTGIARIVAPIII